MLYTGEKRMQQKCDGFDWVSDFNIDRTIGGLALLKVNFIGNELACNIIDSAIRYLKILNGETIKTERG